MALKEVFLTKAHLAVVMEYVKGANMPTFLAQHAPLPEDDARSAPFRAVALVRHSCTLVRDCAGRLAMSFDLPPTNSPRVEAFAVHATFIAAECGPCMVVVQTCARQHHAVAVITSCIHLLTMQVVFPAAGAGVRLLP